MGANTLYYWRQQTQPGLWTWGRVYDGGRERTLSTASSKMVAWMDIETHAQRRNASADIKTYY